MICSLSGHQTVRPVVSSKSHRVFEKPVLEAWIKEKGTDPFTNEPLTEKDVIPLDLAITDGTVATTSIPQSLENISTSFNAVVLENHQLRQELEQTRRDLSTQMYRNEAALRVITRLASERDEAQEALAALEAVDPGEASEAGEASETSE